MPIDGMVREYTWADLMGLVLKDLGLPPDDKQFSELWLLGGFTSPSDHNSVCLRATKYEKPYKQRLEEITRQKI